MKNRGFLCAFAFLALLIAAPAMAQEKFVEGVHFNRIENAQPSAGGDIEVIEFFSYGCSHCNDFEPTLAEWKKTLPEHVDFRPVPAGLGRAIFQQLAAVFYIADELGVLGQAHEAMFAEIHEKNNRAIMSRDGLAAFFARFGVEEAAFDAAISSTAVQERFAAGEQLARTYGLQGVPMMVVDGTFSVMRSGDVTSYDQMLEVVDFLVEREAASTGG